MSGRSVQYIEEEPISIIEDLHDALFLVIIIMTCGLITVFLKRRPS